MNTHQDFWERLQKRYEDKHKTLLTREAELRYKLEAMDAIMRDRRNVSQKTQSPVMSITPSSLPEPKTALLSAVQKEADKETVGNPEKLGITTVSKLVNKDGVTMHKNENCMCRLAVVESELSTPVKKQSICSCSICSQISNISTIYGDNSTSITNKIPNKLKSKEQTYSFNQDMKHTSDDICKCSICSKMSNIQDYCLCNYDIFESQTRPDTRIAAEASATPRNSLSLKSLDLYYMKNIHDLATRERTLLNNITDLEKRAKIYDDVFKEYQGINISEKGEKNSAVVADREQKVNSEMKLENFLLQNELNDMKLEVKQYIEKMEGPMRLKIESERYKNKQLEHKLEQAAKDLMNTQELYDKKINAVKMQLYTANSNVYNLTTSSQKLNEELELYKAKCEQLEEDLKRRKISEVESLKKLQFALKAQTVQPAQPASVKEECDLHQIARELSSILKECEPCGECLNLPEDLTTAARLLKSLTDMIDQKLPSESDKQHNEKEEMEERCSVVCDNECVANNMSGNAVKETHTTVSPDVALTVQKPLVEQTVDVDFESTSLGKILFNKCNQIGDEICQIDPIADLSETYDSAKLRSIRLALQLRKMGIRATDIISTCSCNTMDSAIPTIATLFLGAKVFNLDPRISIKNVTHLLTIVHPAVMFIEEASLPKFQECFQETNFKGHIVVFGNYDRYPKFSDLIKPDPEEENFTPAEAHMTDLAILVYSSGTTGLPKVVCHSNYSFLQLLKLIYSSNLGEGRPIHNTSLSWISALSVLIFCWMFGGTRLFYNGVSGEHTFRIIEKYKATLLFVPIFDTYNITNVENPERFDVSSLRKLLTGGSSVSGKQVKKLGSLFKNAIILNAYGTSETGTITVFDSKKHDKSFIESKDGSCGKVCLGASVRVVDLETNEVLGPHKRGEVRIKSIGMMVDYYKHDSSDYFDSDKYFKSGDVGYYDEEGCFYVIARCKEIFKYKGWPIAPSLIEQNLLEHPAVYDVAVFGVPYGDDGEAPAACIVLKKNVQVNEKDIQSFLKDRVADEEQLRGGIMFVDKVPRTPTGKVDLKKLEEFKNSSSF